MAVKEKEEVSVSEEKSKALKMAIEKIEKDFGKGSIMKLGDKIDHAAAIRLKAKIGDAVRIKVVGCDYGNMRVEFVPVTN